MTDHGHELAFGGFLTPAAGRPDQVVALATLCEQAGLDLVTFQDHPYQPGFLDTWTLMSYVAAATDRIGLAGNVLNLPLRQPVVLARSVASLDLLTGGRVELGLGAGAFWDAIEAAGGRRLSPGAAVDALDEAIQVVREVWDTGRRGMIRVDGEHYRVVGAKRGPAPAHPVGIWVGAYKPRMLRLVGRAADGWLPSLAYLSKGPDDLPALNALVNEGAEAAGRDPGAVRRMLNVTGTFARSSTGFLAGPPEQWVEELAGLTLEHGVTTFVLGSDEPRAIQLFAQEVAPAVRELVAAERTTPGSGARAVVEEQAAAGGPSTLAVTPTPDPGVRLSARRLWDETTRPTAPPPPAGHVYPARAQAAGQHLVDVHDHLRQELAQVRDLLEQVRRGAVSPGGARAALNAMTMRQNDWTLGAYCAAYCTVVTQHHGLEGASVFPHLRRADASLAPVLDRLEQEHVVIHGVVESVDRALVELVASPGDFTGLQEAVDLLTDTLLSHLSYEEHQIVEPLARHGFFPDQL
ncbi:LLM class flavin-dependent oxidoreductase [Micromonospora robiginosa]|uniref:LLM class flavin-dependent oxidoreductase n=1 Tax=Micromonospora robiginosa TaxID=2749844 RepID=A0A7L6B261_9ACTN|nr:LLM class flavin-dependent oxidoreductase [Micromonospora ferruginea]QLQ36062.1 LLM class flavin-dependent oxidoreductase [Micromonospora ferruginea]